MHTEQPAVGVFLNTMPSTAFYVDKLLPLPFLEGLSDNGSIRYTLKALFPFFILLSFTSSMSGREFIAQRKFAFHVFGSGLSTPDWYFPKQEKKVRHVRNVIEDPRQISNSIV